MCPLENIFDVQNTIVFPPKTYFPHTFLCCSTSIQCSTLSHVSLSPPPPKKTQSVLIAQLSQAWADRFCDIINSHTGRVKLWLFFLQMSNHAYSPSPQTKVDDVCCFSPESDFLASADPDGVPWLTLDKSKPVQEMFPLVRQTSLALDCFHAVIKLCN